MSIGGSASDQQQQSQSKSNASGFNQSSSTSGSFVDPNQQPFLQQLYSAAFGQYGDTATGMAGVTDQANATSGAAVDNLLGLGNTDSVINAQLEGLKSGLGEIQQQGLNTLGDNAVRAGAFGGSRHGVTEAALSGEIGDAFTRGYGDIMANASNQAIAANQGALAGAGQSIANNIMGNFGGLQALAGILGGPTILQEAQSQSEGGYQSTSTSNASGSGSSEGFDFGFGK